jgi:hypothetical protein
MTRAFTDPLPLRTTAAWGRFRESVVIPHRYGEVTAAPLQYDAGRRLYVWADHPSATIREVRVGGQRIDAWRHFNGTDSAGRGVTFVELSQPLVEGATLEVTGIGKRHARTGVVLSNPADVLHDLVANVAGMAVEESDLDAFRADAATLGVVVAGSIEAAASVQTPCAALCASIGAVFCATMPGLARIFPGGALDAYVAAEVEARHEVDAGVQLDDVVTAIVVRYDYAGGEPRRTLTLEAPDAIAQYGRRERVLEAAWVANGRVAYDVAQRLLEHRARPVWRLSAEGLAGRLHVGQTARFAHPLCPYEGLAFVTQVALDVPALKASSIEAVAAAGRAPRVVLAGQGSQFEPDEYASATLATRGSERVVTISDEAGRPLGDARVVLDGAMTRYTDAAGRVTFPASAMPPGEHVLEVTKGTRALVLEVVV